MWPKFWFTAAVCKVATIKLQLFESSNTYSESETKTLLIFYKNKRLLLHEFLINKNKIIIINVSFFMHQKEVWKNKRNYE